jgi:hypothetical protein
MAMALLTGDVDKVGPADVSHELAAAHGNAAVEIFPGCGHWTALEAARATTDQLVKFLLTEHPMRRRRRPTLGATSTTRTQRREEGSPDTAGRIIAIKAQATASRIPA